MILLVQNLSTSANLPMAIVIELITRQGFVNVVLRFRNYIAAIQASFILCFCGRPAGAMGQYLPAVITALDQTQVRMAFGINIAPHISCHIVICVIAVGSTAYIAFCFLNTSGSATAMFSLAAGYFLIAAGADLEMMCGVAPQIGFHMTQRSNITPRG